MTSIQNTSQENFVLDINNNEANIRFSIRQIYDLNVNYIFFKLPGPVHGLFVNNFNKKSLEIKENFKKL